MISIFEITHIFGREQMNVHEVSKLGTSTSQAKENH